MKSLKNIQYTRYFTNKQSGTEKRVGIKPGRNPSKYLNSFLGIIYLITWMHRHIFSNIDWHYRIPRFVFPSEK